MAAGSGTEQLKQAELYRTGVPQQGFRSWRGRRAAWAFRTAQRERETPDWRSILTCSRDACELAERTTDAGLPVVASSPDRCLRDTFARDETVRFPFPTQRA